MTALILTPAETAALMAAVDAAYLARGLAPYWQPMPVPIVAGAYAGRLAVDVGPEALAMQMRDGLSLAQLPDFTAILTALGNPVPVTVAQSDLKKEVVRL